MIYLRPQRGSQEMPTCLNSAAYAPSARPAPARWPVFPRQPVQCSVDMQQGKRQQQSPRQIYYTTATDHRLEVSTEARLSPPGSLSLTRQCNQSSGCRPRLRRPAALPGRLLHAPSRPAGCHCPAACARSKHCHDWYTCMLAQSVAPEEASKQMLVSKNLGAL